MIYPTSIAEIIKEYEQRLLPQIETPVEYYAKSAVVKLLIEHQDEDIQQIFEALEDLKQKSVSSFNRQCLPGGLYSIYRGQQLSNTIERQIITEAGAVACYLCYAYQLIPRIKTPVPTIASPGITIWRITLHYQDDSILTTLHSGTVQEAIRKALDIVHAILPINQWPWLEYIEFEEFYEGDPHYLYI